MGPGPAAVPGGRAPPTWRASSLDLGLFIELAAILKSLLFRKLGLGPKEMEEREQPWLGPEVSGQSGLKSLLSFEQGTN